MAPPPTHPQDDHSPQSAPRLSRLALLACLTYALVAVGVHHAWPFYVFDMYAFAAPGTASRLSLVDDAGTTRDVRDVAAIRCAPDARAVLDGEPCQAWWTVVARDDEVWDVLRSRPLASGERGAPATLVRRGWRWGAPADAPPGERVTTTAPVATDCARVRCEVRW